MPVARTHAGLCLREDALTSWVMRPDETTRAGCMGKGRCCFEARGRVPEGWHNKEEAEMVEVHAAESSAARVVRRAQPVRLVKEP